MIEIELDGNVDVKDIEFFGYIYVYNQHDNVQNEFNDN